MTRHVACFLFLPLVGLSSGRGQEEAKTTPPSPNEVEVRFNDESVLRMTILQENLEVVTKYGKLTVPTKDIRRIEFGAHLADGLGKKIEALVKDLGSKSFQDRETANKQLLALGPKTYAALARAAKSKDPEVNQRVQTLVKKLRERFAPEQLLVRENDLIQTSEFTIAGRVTSPTMRARTAYFGEPEIPLAQLRSIRWLVQGGRTEVAIDAALYGSGNGQWLDTGVEVNVGDHLAIKATGELDLQPANPGMVVCGPAGFNQGGGVRGGVGGALIAGGGGRGGINRRQLGGALLGRIGENGQTFVIGERFQGRIAEAGKLQLQIAPNQFGNQATGSFTVTIGLGDPGSADR